MVLKKSPDDFLSVIEHTKIELSALLYEHGITLNTKVLTENTNATFDKQRMIQVLINLISNSIKFSPKGSEICVTVMEGRSSGGADVLRCSVGDEGPGLPQDELETVFEKFTQSSDTKSGAGGTGLGLPICREIVKAHGGSICAENRQSKGALFSFVVPRRQGA
jgi:signal transduction histidine kinase